AIQIELEGAEKFPHAYALQPVGAAGQPACAVGRLREQQAQPKRDHDQSEMAESSNDEARGITEQARGGSSCSQPGQRLAPAPLGNQARCIRTKPEMGGMA